MNQIPAFLIKMQGFHFGIKNLFVLLGLCLLEFFNALTIVSFMLSVFFKFYNDFIFGEGKLIFIQLGVKSMKLFKILLLNCALYGAFFVVSDLFIVPYSNVFLKKTGLEMYKNKVFYSIKPKHIVNIPELNLNISIADRVKNRLTGCLVHLEKHNVFCVVEKLFFQKGTELNIDFYNLKGKISTDFDTLMFTFASGVLNANTDVITIPYKIAFFDIDNWHEVFARVAIFLISLLIGFLVFIVFFSDSILEKIISILLFVILFTNSIGFIEISWQSFVLFYLIIILFWGRGMKCLDF